MEQKAFLRNIGQRFAPARPVRRVEPRAADQDLAGLRFEQGDQQVDQRRLARARRSGNAGEAARIEGEARLLHAAAAGMEIGDVPNLDRAGWRGDGGEAVGQRRSQVGVELANCLEARQREEEVLRRGLDLLRGRAHAGEDQDDGDQHRRRDAGGEAGDDDDRAHQRRHDREDPPARCLTPLEPQLPRPHIGLDHFEFADEIALRILRGGGLKPADEAAGAAHQRLVRADHPRSHVADPALAEQHDHAADQHQRCGRQRQQWGQGDRERALDDQHDRRDTGLDHELRAARDPRHLGGHQAGDAGMAQLDDPAPGCGREASHDAVALLFDKAGLQPGQRHVAGVEGHDAHDRQRDEQREQYRQPGEG